MRRDPARARAVRPLPAPPSVARPSPGRVRAVRLLPVWAACLAAVLVLVRPVPAEAHVVAAGADLRVAQTIAGTELTVVVEGVERVPGELRIGVVAYQPVTGLPVALELRSVADGRTVTGTAHAGREPRYTPLWVERAGPHELRLRAGDEVAVVPFRVLVERASVWEPLIYGGLFTAGLLLVGGLLTGALSRPRPAMLLAGGAAVGLTIAFAVVVLEPWLPPSPPDGAAPTAEAGVQGRPFAQGRVATVPARPVAGEEFTLRIDLVDGSTGLPLDDLAVHHEALAHLVVTSEDGRAFHHVHPLRTAPGRLEVRMRAARPGRHLAYAELERQDSGGQLVTGEFTVGGEPSPAKTSPAESAATEPSPAETPSATASAEPSPAGPAGRPGPPRLHPAVPVAGRPATIEVETSGAVRPWLGMAGHLIVRSHDGAFLGHVHEMGSAGSGRLRFTFGFPAAGRYLAWAQYATGDRIVTVPFTVDVTAPEATR
ncbi:hypothetical protein Ppa06_45190 [Planomonospora parontospora subsp. parontospora]|uniref:Secreted protein n=2 Tax=Planomonospora parontospora TaxID=58119 RepID=A0AA37F6N9_9ACTN|nr:hypothetical protein GCM10010126_51070 [Planomonospora parontospora]GII10721.1 hypothetical protein Ppa06_45190 [Planomonospora parontospora subsp. parontospora]